MIFSIDLLPSSKNCAETTVIPPYCDSGVQKFTYAAVAEDVCILALLGRNEVNKSMGFLTEQINFPVTFVTVGVKRKVASILVQIVMRFTCSESCIVKEPIMVVDVLSLFTLCYVVFRNSVSLQMALPGLRAHPTTIVTASWFGLLPGHPIHSPARMQMSEVP